MTRTKRRAETVPAARDQAEAERFIARIGELQRDLRLENSTLAETIAKAKEATAEAVVELLRPIQARYHELEEDPGAMVEILAKGAAKAQAVSSVVLDRAKRNVGLLPR